MTWTCDLRVMGEVGACVLWSRSLVHQGNLPSYLPLEMEVGSFLIPTSDSSGDIIHGLDSLHEPDGDSGRKVRGEGGGVFDFVVLGMNEVQLELIDVFLELLSSGNASSGEPVHGFLLGIGISKSPFKAGLKNGEGPEGLVGKTLLMADFGPHGSRPLLHVRQGVGNLPVVIMVEGLVDKEIKANGVQPGLGCLCLSIVFIGASDANLSDP